MKLYFLACGTTDFLYEGSKALDKTLTEQGLDHIFYESDGGHVWANWRLYLNYGLTGDSISTPSLLCSSNSLEKR